MTETSERQDLPSGVVAHRTGGAARLRRILLRPESASLGALIAVFAAFAIIEPELFLAKDTFVSIMSLAADIGIVALGVTLLMIGGHFDLSVGSVLGLSSFIGVTLVTQFNLSPVFAILITLVSAALIGAVNGLIVVSTGLHSFVVTLGTLLWARGLLLWGSAGQVESLSLPSSFVDIVAGRVFFGFRMSLLWLIVLAVFGSILLVRTRFGNWTFAIGNNPRAAEELGVPLKRTTVALFILSSVGAGVVGVVQAARFDSVDPNRGQGLELIVIAAVVIGGTLLTGGFGSILGTVVGAVVFATIQVGLILVGVPGFWFNTTVGILLVAAVLTNRVLVRIVLQSQAGGSHSGDEAAAVSASISDGSTS